MENKLSPLKGFIVFAAVMVCFVIFGSFFQYSWGIWGLAATEIMFLFIAFAAASLFGVSFREAFPMRLPPVKEFAGSFLLYISAFLLITPVVIITEIFFPQISDSAAAISGIADGASPYLCVFAMAFLPAVCEELLHRGMILGCMKKIRNDAAVTLIMALLFGLFHLDPYRFLPTAMLGAVFTYTAIKTRSVFLPMLLHFINNLISVVSILAERSDNITESAIVTGNAANIGVCITYIGLGIVPLTLGAFILNKKKINSVTVLVAAIGSVVLTACGIVITSLNI